MNHRASSEVGPPDWNERYPFFPLFHVAASA